MEYERKNLCCDDGFLIIFCHDRYYKVHFYFYQIIINIRVIVCFSIHLTVSGYTSSRCCSGIPTEVRPHHHTAIMIHKITHKKLLPGGFHVARKTTVYNLRGFSFNLALEIQHRIPEKKLFLQRCKAMEFSPNYDYSRTVSLGFQKSLRSLGLQRTN